MLAQRRSPTLNTPLFPFSMRALITFQTFGHGQIRSILMFPLLRIILVLTRFKPRTPTHIRSACTAPMYGSPYLGGGREERSTNSVPGTY
jgi:hypothetical protein